MVRYVRVWMMLVHQGLLVVTHTDSVLGLVDDRFSGA